MSLDDFRFYRVDDKFIYAFNLNERKVWRFVFKPFNKRYRFRHSKMFIKFHRFTLLDSRNLHVSDPACYLEFCSFEWREFKIGDYI